MAGGRPALHPDIPVDNPAVRAPQPLVIPDRVPHHVPVDKIMDGRIAGVPYFANVTPEAGLTLMVHGKKYLHDYCLCDTACNLVIVSKDVADEMGLTPSPDPVQLYQVAGMAAAGVYSNETVSAVWLEGTQHAVTLHTDARYLILERSSPVFKVLVGSPLLDRVCGRPCAALGEFGLHPYYSKGLLKPAFTIPLCRLPPRQLATVPVGHAGVPGYTSQWPPYPTAGRDWLGEDVRDYCCAAVALGVPRHTRTRQEIQTSLARSNIERNPGP